MPSKPFIELPDCRGKPYFLVNANAIESVVPETAGHPSAFSREDGGEQCLVRIRGERSEKLIGASYEKLCEMIDEALRPETP